MERVPSASRLNNRGLIVWLVLLISLWGCLLPPLAHRTTDRNAAALFRTSTNSPNHLGWALILASALATKPSPPGGTRRLNKARLPRQPWVRADVDHALAIMGPGSMPHHLCCGGSAC
eukprot:scaffold7588_cov133-Isochrysis_galbana.AAC.1